MIDVDRERHAIWQAQLADMPIAVLIADLERRGYTVVRFFPPLLPFEALERRGYTVIPPPSLCQCSLCRMRREAVSE